MPSSTFSFSGKVPPGSWNRTWVWALIIAIGVLGVIEVALRHHGIVPMVTDDEGLWSYWRRQATLDTNTVVFVGSSRIQLAIRPEAWRSVFPEQKAVQLAIDGNGPLPVLEDLADDPSFRGIVICDVAENILIDDREDPNADGRARKFVHFYHKKWNLQEYIDRLLQTRLQSSFTVARGWDLIELGKRLINPNRKAFERDYIITQPDRSRQADYRLVDLAKHRMHWLEINRTLERRVPAKGQLSEGFKRMCAANQKIRDRGGQVFFVKFPVSGDLRILEEKLYPRDEFWDEFARRFGPYAIHFADTPLLRSFTCAEGSHLDMRDGPHFTRALAEELKKRILYLTRGLPDWTRRKA